MALCMCSFLKKGTWEPTLEKRATMSAMVASNSYVDPAAEEEDSVNKWEVEMEA